MKSIRTKPRVSKLRMGFFAVVLASAVFVSASLFTGYGFRLLNFAKALPGVVRAIANNQSVTDLNGGYRNVIFLHHSVGEGLIQQGGVREIFTQAGYHFWDQGYNQDGLNDPTGKNLGYSYTVPNNNTDPDGLLEVFSQPVFGLPLNTFSALLQYDVIAFKSCFPASHITSDAQLEERKAWYLKMRDVMDQHRDHAFIVITQPPLNPAETDPAAARRAYAFASWLTAAEYSQGHPNIFVYDLFSALAETNPTAPDFGMLRAQYRNGSDSHPNETANQTLGPELAQFIMKASDVYQAAQ